MKVFLAYHPSDQESVKQLKDYFVPAIKKGDLKIWDRSMILLELEAIEIQKHLQAADLVVFLLSSNLLAEKFYYEIEQDVIRRVKNGTQNLIPVLWGFCDWESTSIVQELSVQFLPRDQKPVIGTNQAVKERISEVAKEILAFIRRKSKEQKQANSGVDKEKQAINQIKNSISNGRIQEAVDALLTIAKKIKNEELTNSVFLLNNRYNNIKRQEISGAASYEKLSREKNKITNHGLSILDELEEEFSLKNSPVPSQFLDQDQVLAKIKTLLKNNQTEETFKLLDSLLQNSSNQELLNMLLLLKSRYNRAVGDQKQGITTSENIETEKNKIALGIMHLIEEIPKEIRARGIEESDVYLESIKKSTDFSLEQKSFSDVKKGTFNKDESIDSLFEELEEKLSFEDYPELFDYYQDIKNKYHNNNSISNTDLSQEDRLALEEIKDQLARKEMAQVVDKLRDIRAAESRAKAQKTTDFSKADTVFLNEAKLILVGNGKVGKTTLRENLIDPTYKLTKHKSTDGLEVIPWNFPLMRTNSPVTMKFNIWDFGGQGRYRAIQQFFCTSQAIYLFLTTPIEEENLTDDNYTGFDYWLKFIQLYGYDAENDNHSPVIYIMNKCDLGGDQTIDKQSLQEKYENIHQFIHVSCETGQGLKELRTELEKRLQEENFINRSFPRTWLNIKNRLEALSQDKPILNFESYLNIFNQEAPPSPSQKADIQRQAEELAAMKLAKLKKHLGSFKTSVYYSKTLAYWQSVKEENEWALLLATRMNLERHADVLLKYLHTTGTILYYPNVKSLAHILILNPDWARQLAYKIFNSKHIVTGIISKEDILSTFEDDEKKTEYATDLLKTYNLGYEVDIKGMPTYYIPSLFPVEKPSNLEELSSVSYKATYSCVFSPLIPADFTCRLISRLSDHIHGANQFWKYGVLLKHTTADGTMALVEEFWRENKIEIKIDGDSWKELLAIITNEIFDLNKDIGQAHFSKTVLLEKIQFATQDPPHDLSRNQENEFLPHHFDLAPAFIPEAVQPTTATEKLLDLSKEMQKRFHLISANPNDKRQLRFDQEFRQIKKARITARKEEFIEIDYTPCVESRELTQVLRQDANIIHISTHGSREKGLLFINPEGEEAAVEVEELEFIFDELKEDFENLNLVCLSACNSLDFAKKLAHHVDFVIGIDGIIKDEIAILFSEMFYKNVFENSSIEFSFKIALKEIKRQYKTENKKIEDRIKLYSNGKEV